MSKLQIQIQENVSAQWIPMALPNEYTDADVHDVARQYTTDVIRSESYVTSARVLKPGPVVLDDVLPTYWIEEATYKRTDFTRDEEALAHAVRLAAKYADLD